jgi:hypothetical protein
VINDGEEYKGVDNAVGDQQGSPTPHGCDRVSDRCLGQAGDWRGACSRRRPVRGQDEAE